MTAQSLDPPKDAGITRRPFIASQQGKSRVLGTSVKKKQYKRYRGWVTVATLLDHMAVSRSMLTDEDLRYLQLSVDAANRAVAFWRPDLEVPWVMETKGPFANTFSWEYDGGIDISGYREDYMIVLGTTMLATSWYQRRSQDIAAFAEFGGPPPAVGRDIEQLLRINRAHAPVVA